MATNHGNNFRHFDNYNMLATYMISRQSSVSSYNIHCNCSSVALVATYVCEHLYQWQLNVQKGLIHSSNFLTLKICNYIASYIDIGLCLT